MCNPYTFWPCLPDLLCQQPQVATSQVKLHAQFKRIIQGAIQGQTGCFSPPRGSPVICFGSPRVVSWHHFPPMKPEFMPLQSGATACTWAAEGKSFPSPEVLSRGFHLPSCSSPVQQPRPAPGSSSLRQGLCPHTPCRGG